MKDEIEESEEAGKTCNACKTPTNYLAYYNGLIEKDAHAAGITVEVMHLDNPDNPISSKNVEATMTWERIKGRLDNTEHDICNRIDENFVGELLIELTCLAEQYAELWRSET